MSRPIASRGSVWPVRCVNPYRTFFFRDDLGYLSDCLHADAGTPAEAAVADNALRPNQLFALTLGAVTDKTVAERILFACQELIVPGAIRSLADRPIDPALPVYHNGGAGQRSPIDHTWASMGAMKIRAANRPTITARPGPGSSPVLRSLGGLLRPRGIRDGSGLAGQQQPADR
jgi:hypothetical protein